MPVVSSSSPVSRSPGTVGTRGKSHRRRKPAATPASTTQAQTVRIESTARRTASGSETVLAVGERELRDLPGQNADSSRLVSAWRTNSAATCLRGRSCGSTPKRKEGPQRLHRPSILAPSLLLKAPPSTAWLMAAAPTGKPPAQPKSQMPSAPRGIPNRRDSQSRRSPCNSGDSIPLITNRGNRLGTRVRAQSTKASQAEAAAQRLSRISAVPASSRAAAVPFFKIHHLGKVYDREQCA